MTLKVFRHKEIDQYVDSLTAEECRDRLKFFLYGDMKARRYLNKCEREDKTPLKSEILEENRAKWR